MPLARVMAVAVIALMADPSAEAQATYTVASSADAFLAAGSASNPKGANLAGLNFGGAGTLVVASASSANGEFQSVIKFNLSGATNLFDTTYGANNWTVSGVSLELTSNYGTAGVQPNNPIFDVISGGQFVIEWLSNDNWAEGTGTPNLPTTDGVTYDSLPSLLSGSHEMLSTNTYSPPGNNVHVTWTLPTTANLTANIAAGGDVSFLLYAADSQIYYLFNSYFYGRGNEPLIHVTANPLHLKIISGYLTNADFHLTGLGAPNVQYQIQAATNLGAAHWQTLETVTADNAGTIQFSDGAAADQSRRFYRLLR
jgi:hypothetical protein